ncbi:MAG: hypothetical protein MZU84_05070 [Sphingobacterium sp.]|nr:hypothetical protein [Sphingobacterium sp.]
MNERLWFITLPPREGSFNVWMRQKFPLPGLRRWLRQLMRSGNLLQAKDSSRFGAAFRASFEAQVAMFPLMKSRTVSDTIDYIKIRPWDGSLPVRVAGAYLVLVSERPG